MSSVWLSIFLFLLHVYSWLQKVNKRRQTVLPLLQPSFKKRRRMVTNHAPLSTLITVEGMIDGQLYRCAGRVILTGAQLKLLTEWPCCYNVNNVQNSLHLDGPPAFTKCDITPPATLWLSFLLVICTI